MSHDTSRYLQFWEMPYIGKLYLELATEVALEPTLYITISKGYIPKDRIEKNYYLSTKKRNLLLSNK